MEKVKSLIIKVLIAIGVLLIFIQVGSNFSINHANIKCKVIENTDTILPQKDYQDSIWHKTEFMPIN